MGTVKLKDEKEKCDYVTHSEREGDWGGWGRGGGVRVRDNGNATLKKNNDGRQKGGKGGGGGGKVIYKIDEFARGKWDKET